MIFQSSVSESTFETDNLNDSILLMKSDFNLHFLNLLLKQKLKAIDIPDTWINFNLHFLNLLLKRMEYT